MDFRTVLTSLADAGVDFIVVGGVAAVLQGVPATTFDLNVVPSREPANRARLIEVLVQLEACYREHLPARRLVPREEDLGSSGHHLLLTRAGPLDLLGTVHGGQGFEELRASASELELEGRRILVLDLDALLRLKEALGREKDLLQARLLRRTLEERRGQG
jgi:hypothetical protein